MKTPGNDEAVVKKGNLLISSWSLVRKSWTRRFCALYDTSSRGVRRLELFENEESFTKGHSAKILVLEDAVKIHTLAKTNKESNIFEIVTERRSIQLRAESLKHMSDWVEELRKVSFSGKQKIVTMSDTPPDNKNIPEGSSDVAINENYLYGAIENTFSVKLVSTPASEKCGLDPTELNYVIVLGQDSMMLEFGDVNNFYANDEEIDKLLYEWHYPYIRRYGIVNGFFSFEAGRKCSSGEGLFSFDAPDVRLIFERLASFMKLAGEKRKHLKAASPVQHCVGDDGTQTKFQEQICPISSNIDKVIPQDENCEGCKKLTNDNEPIMFGRACAVPQTPVVYANLTDPESLSKAPRIDHIVVGDGVEYARVMKTSRPPPPPPHLQTDSVETDSVEDSEAFVANC